MEKIFFDYIFILIFGISSSALSMNTTSSEAIYTYLESNDYIKSEKYLNKLKKKASTLSGKNELAIIAKEIKRKSIIIQIMSDVKISHFQIEFPAQYEELLDILSFKYLDNQNTLEDSATLEDKLISILNSSSSGVENAKILANEIKILFAIGARLERYEEHIASLISKLDETDTD